MAKKNLTPLEEAAAYNASLQRELIIAIIDNYGGETYIADQLGFSQQNVHTWILYGKVPMKHLYHVHKEFDVPVWALNYLGVLQVLGPDESPRWKDVVGACNLATTEQNRILSLGRPSYAK